MTASAKACGASLMVPHADFAQQEFISGAQPACNNILFRLSPCPLEPMTHEESREQLSQHFHRYSMRDPRRQFQSDRCPDCEARSGATSLTQDQPKRPA